MMSDVEDGLDNCDVHAVSDVHNGLVTVTYIGLMRFLM
jgi:hypothetical protein